MPSTRGRLPSLRPAPDLPSDRSRSRLRHEALLFLAPAEFRPLCEAVAATLRLAPPATPHPQFAAAPVRHFFPRPSPMRPPRADPWDDALARSARADELALTIVEHALRGVVEQAEAELAALRRLGVAVDRPAACVRGAVAHVISLRRTVWGRESRRVDVRGTKHRLHRASPRPSQWSTKRSGSI